MVKQFLMAENRVTGKRHLVGDGARTLCGLVTSHHRYNFYHVEFIIDPILYCPRCIAEHSRRLNDEEKAANHEVPVSPDA